MSCRCFAYLPQIGLLAFLLAPHGGAGAAAPNEPAGSLAADARLARKLTVRVSGMPLDQLLPLLSRELGVTLRAGTADVGDIRVALFAEDLPAYRTLEALTRMLNATPERGFAWERKQGSSPGYTLTLDARARSQATRRLRQFQREADRRLLQRIAALEEDPETRKLGEDPNPASRAFGRAPYLLSSLSDAQLTELVQDGKVVLRYGQVDARQQRVLARMGGDLTARLQRLMENDPELIPLYTNLKPEQTVFFFTLDRSATEPYVFGQIKLGPGKGGFRNQVFPIPTGPVPPSPLRSPNAGPMDPARPRLELRPAGWAMADVLSELARRTQKPLVSDCYSLDWARLRASGPSPLEQLQKRIDELWQVQWSEADGFLIGRSRIYFARQAWEVPERLVTAWAREIQSEPRLRLDTLAQMALLSKPQLESLDQNAAFQAIAPEVNYFPHFFHAPLRVYGLLSPAQRLQVHNGGFQLGYDAMSPAQQRAFTDWMLDRNPQVLEADLAGANLRMTFTPAGHFDLAWKAGEVTGSMGTWLHLHRDLNTGGPIQREKPIVDDLHGKPLPAVTVRRPDGSVQPLRFPAGKPALVLFRSLRPVPYVGPEPDDADLRRLEEHVAKHPDLTGRVVWIAPFSTDAEVQAWFAPRKHGLPATADPDGSAARLCAAERFPRALVVDGEGKVARVLSSLDELRTADWEALLPVR